MTTTSITIVTAARSIAEDRLLSGVFGHIREDGAFEVDASLKDRIYMFSLMAARPLPGLQTQTVEIDSEHANALRATLLAALGRRWAVAYEQMTGGHELAQAEKEVVARAVADAIASMGLPAYRVGLAKKFKALQAHFVSSEEAGGEEDWDGDDPFYAVNLEDVLLHTAETPWSITSAEPLVISNEGIAQVQIETPVITRARSPGVDVNYVSGGLRSMSVIYGSNDLARTAILAVMGKLPAKLLNEILDKNSTTMIDMQWHTPGDIMSMVRQAVAAGDPVSVEEMALLSPHSDRRDRLVWAEGVLAARALTQAQEEAIDPADAAAAAADVPRM